MSDIREEIAGCINQALLGYCGAGEAADKILAIPAIAEALAMREQGYGQGVGTPLARWPR